MDYYDVYPDMTPEEEQAAYLADCLDEVRWPIEDDGYLEALDRDGVCRICRADCSAANPPVVDCPMERSK